MFLVILLYLIKLVSVLSFKKKGGNSKPLLFDVISSEGLEHVVVGWEVVPEPNGVRQQCFTCI